MTILVHSMPVTLTYDLFFCRQEAPNRVSTYSKQYMLLLLHLRVIIMMALCLSLSLWQCWHLTLAQIQLLMRCTSTSEDKQGLLNMYRASGFMLGFSLLLCIVTQQLQAPVAK